MYCSTMTPPKLHLSRNFYAYVLDPLESCGVAVGLGFMSRALLNVNHPDSVCVNWTFVNLNSLEVVFALRGVSY
jgi:hypothetical protein